MNTFRIIGSLEKLSEVAGFKPRAYVPKAHMLDISFVQPIQLANLHTRLHQRKVESFDQTNGPFR